MKGALFETNIAPFKYVIFHLYYREKIFAITFTENKIGSE